MARKKIYPTLFEIYRNALIPHQTVFVGYARSGIEISKLIEKSIRVYGHLKGDEDEEILKQFIEQNVYVQGTYENDEDFERLSETVRDIEGQSKIANRLFYLALPATVFEDVTKQIHDHCLSDHGWNRVIIEKPFGHDYDSSEKLSRHLAGLFSENQIYRIDHYLGKEMVQNLMILRFANRIFSPIWNRENISSVMITFKENFGTQGRGGYFDSFGIIRDVMQNHLLQILSLVAMERPVSASAEDIRNEKVRFLYIFEFVFIIILYF